MSLDYYAFLSASPPHFGQSCLLLASAIVTPLAHQGGYYQVPLPGGLLLVAAIRCRVSVIFVIVARR